MTEKHLQIVIFLHLSFEIKYDFQEIKKNILSI